MSGVVNVGVVNVAQSFRGDLTNVFMANYEGTLPSGSVGQ